MVIVKQHVRRRTGKTATVARLLGIEANLKVDSFKRRHPQGRSKTVPVVSDTIWYAGKELTFRMEVDSIDEAQALLDFERRHGREAAATHYNGKHQIYAEVKRAARLPQA